MRTLLTLILLNFYIVANSQIPQVLTGNWINEKTNDWQYGFFEEFAIYNCDFWEYVSVKNNGKKSQVSLKNGDNVISLEITIKNDSTLTIKEDKKNAQTYNLMRKNYPAYLTKDATRFPTPTFTQDSVTITGYYRNFDKIPEQHKQAYGQNSFQIEVPNFVASEDVNYATSIDSQGRFSIKIPVVNTQGVYADWRRLNEYLILTPGDNLFIFADMNDLLPHESDGGWEGYLNRSKQILHMGENARVNNEWRQYQYSGKYIDLYKKRGEGISDMDYLKLAEGAYDAKMKHLNDYIGRHPNVSEKFIFSKTIQEKYSFASDLMQYRFSLDRNKGQRFSKGYIEYVEDNFSLTDESVYTFTRNFRNFLTDYIGYYSDANSAPFVVTIDMVDELLKKENRITDETRKNIDDYNKFSRQLEQTSDSVQKVRLFEANKDVFDKINSDNLIIGTMQELFRNYSFESGTHLVDSLIENPILNELWIALSYYETFDHSRSPLSKSEMGKFDSRVKNPYLRNTLLAINEHYEKVNNADIANEGSLKDMKQLEGVYDPEELFRELTEPYKGKVIYLDFWGTWCAPCRRNMKLMGGIKEALKDKDVIFMYLANNSPEQTWQNVIKEMNLTGSNIVHYRLPDRQQQILEQNLSIHSWPTYMLIDKDGNIVNKKAPSPESKDQLVTEIEQLLNQ